MTVNSSRKHLVLVGAGRANLHVLKGLARQGSGDMNVTLVAPQPYYIDPAMLPGYVAGDYALDEVRIALDPLVEASGVTYVAAHVHSLDATGRRIQLTSGDALPYDVLSVDAEPTLEREAVEHAMPGARRNALFVHPYEAFVQLWPQLQADEAGELVVNERLQSESHRQVFVVPPQAPPETGPVLEANLRTAMGGGNFKKAPVGPTRLRTVACGDGHAIAAWGFLAIEGREVWNWKDRRDRRQLAALFTP